MFVNMDSSSLCAFFLTLNIKPNSKCHVVTLCRPTALPQVTFIYLRLARCALFTLYISSHIDLIRFVQLLKLLNCLLHKCYLDFDLIYLHLQCSTLFQMYIISCTSYKVIHISTYCLSVSVQLKYMLLSALFFYSFVYHDFSYCLCALDFVVQYISLLYNGSKGVKFILN